MCGIVGLLIKRPELQSHLGEWMLPMFIGMTERGPDSAGMAVFGPSVPAGLRRLSLYREGANADDWALLATQFLGRFGSGAVPAEGDQGLLQVHGDERSNHAVLTTSAPPAEVRAWLRSTHPAVHVLSVGSHITLYKDTGLPAHIAQNYRFGGLSGSHLVGHTRMATESAVTPAHAHPFTAGEDFCLVHNGSLSNPYSIRRKLEPLGIRFVTDNDTEAACRYLEWRMREGDDLQSAIRQGFEELDGFYTFLMGTATELALVRDAFACKPAVVAETDDYVAIASEFRSLAHLPGIAAAHLFEPEPERIYVWQVPPAGAASRASARVEVLA